MALIQGQTAILTHTHACSTNHRHTLKNVHADQSIWKDPHQCPSRLLNIPLVLLFLSQGLFHTECRWTYMCQQPLCEISVMALGLCVSICVCLRWMRVLWQSVVSAACATLSSTGKLPAQRENNAHKRLSEEASGADVFHMALNGAAAAKCACVCSLHAYEWDRKKTPPWTCL